MEKTYKDENVTVTKQFTDSYRWVKFDARGVKSLFISAKDMLFGVSECGFRKYFIQNKLKEHDTMLLSEDELRALVTFAQELGITAYPLTEQKA